MDRRCIVVCDSGIGGLNLFSNLAKSLKGQTLLYYADFDNLPYGNKSKQELEKIADDNFKRFLPFCPQKVVFACNTLSTNTVEKKWTSGVEIVRVLPKVKSNKKGLLLCTEATAKSEYVKILKKENSLLEVLALDGLAEAVERYVEFGEELDLEKRFYGVLKDYDFISLGCTHYSIIEENLKKIFPFSQFLSGENETFEKIVNSVTTFNTNDHDNELCFLGKGADKVKSLYYKGFLRKYKI